MSLPESKIVIKKNGPDRDEGTFSVLLAKVRGAALKNFTEHI